ncbi:hypothetical protein AK88_01577 [Plasmodium fragile]|uniref:Uncharacterized protein n=1 Tax=Plasmodium fragile TaxID=5857 RepID=A0A0D9QST4_PLAFR|nr:uncharacterized protein AK88_01577 [Plasmodium fragile]KJP88696.1 hypothetical protein AK88_01577 [Plasmodium fragile]
MPKFPLKRKKPSFANTNIKCYLYRSGTKNRDRNTYVVDKKKKVEERVKLTTNTKYNEIVSLFRGRNEDSAAMNKSKNTHYYNFAKADVLTLARRDIERLKKNKFKFLPLGGNRRHHIKKFFTECIFANNVKHLMGTAKRHIHRASLYHIFLLLKLSVDFKNCEFFKLNALEAFTNKVELLGRRQKNGHLGRDDRSVILTYQRIVDDAFFANVDGAAEKPPAQGVYLFDVVSFVNDSVQARATEAPPPSNGVAADASTPPSNGIQPGASRPHSNDIAEVRSPPDRSKPPCADRRHPQRPGNWAHQGGKSDPRKWRGGHRARKEENENHVTPRDEIYKDEIKYFSYNHRTNHLGVYKEIFEKSDQYKCLKFYENEKKKFAARGKDSSPQELLNNKLKSSLLNHSNVDDSNVEDACQSGKVPPRNALSRYTLKESVLNAFLCVCANNYDDRMYKYMKAVYFTNFYVYNPLFLFQYFSHIPASENKFFELYLTEFLKFLNNIIVHFHFYLIPFFTNLNYSTFFLNFFKKKMLHYDEGAGERRVHIYRRSSNHQLLKEKISYTYKNYQSREKNVAFILFLFYEIFRSDSLMEKYRQIYLDNFYLYSSEKQENKHPPLSIFFNFLNYRSVFNKYEDELKGVQIERRQFYKPLVAVTKRIREHISVSAPKNREEEATPPPQGDTLEGVASVRSDRLTLLGRRDSPRGKLSSNFALKRREFLRGMQRAHQEFAASLGGISGRENFDQIGHVRGDDSNGTNGSSGQSTPRQILQFHDAKLKYSIISVRKREVFNMILLLNKHNFTQCGNYLNKFCFFLLNEFCEKDIVTLFTNHLKYNGNDHDLLFLNKIINILIYKKKNISLSNNIIICNSLAKYQLFNNNFFSLDKSNFFDEVNDANIHSLVALLYSWGKLKVRNIDPLFYQRVITEIIKKIDKINEYGLSCLLYGLNNLIDRRKVSIVPGPPGSAQQGNHVERDHHIERDNHVEREHHIARDNRAGMPHQSDAQTVPLENELIRAIVNKLIVFKNMNINSFCISISCLSKINIFPTELYEEVRTVTYKYMHSVNVTSLQHLLLALSKFYIKNKRSQSTDELIFDIFNFLFTYKYNDISFKCACKFLHILSLLNLRDEDFILLLLLVISNEQKLLAGAHGGRNVSYVEEHSPKGEIPKGVAMNRPHSANLNTRSSFSGVDTPVSGGTQLGYRPYGATNTHQTKEPPPLNSHPAAKRTNQSCKYKGSLFIKGLSALKEDDYFKSSHSAYPFFDVKNYKFDLNKVLLIFKNADSSYLVNVLESLYSLSYYSYFSIHLTVVIKNIMIKQIHDLKVSSIMALLFSYVDLHFFDHSLYDLELSLFLNEDSGGGTVPMEEGAQWTDEQTLLLEHPVADAIEKDASEGVEENEKLIRSNRNQRAPNDEAATDALREQLHSLYNHMLCNFKIMNEQERMLYIEKLKLVMCEMKKKRKYFVHNIYNENNTPSVEYILSMIHDYDEMGKENYPMPNGGRLLSQVRSGQRAGSNPDMDARSYRDNGPLSTRKKYGELDNSLKEKHFEQIKNIVDQFSSVKKLHMKDKTLKEKLQKKEYYDDFFFLKYREYYKEDLINLCLETMLKNVTYILNNYKQYKNCSIFFLLLFCDIFLPYTTSDIFFYFKRIQRSYDGEDSNHNRNGNDNKWQEKFEHILENIELSNFTADTIRNVINAKNASHMVIPYLDILQHNNNFLNKAVCANGKSDDGAHCVEDFQHVSGKRDNHPEGETHKQHGACGDTSKEYQQFINSYDSTYKPKKIKFENIVPLNLLYKFFQLVNFNINNVQLIYLLNEVIKENESNELVGNDNTMQFSKNEISPDQFRKVCYPLIQIRNKTLIVYKNSKKVFFKNFNIIDHYFKPSRGMLIQILDNGIHKAVSIYVDVYIVAYKVDILIERHAVLRQ